jgi:hypothetical protein
LPATKKFVLLDKPNSCHARDAQAIEEPRVTALSAPKIPYESQWLVDEVYVRRVIPRRVVAHSLSSEDRVRVYT